MSKKIRSMIIIAVLVSSFILTGCANSIENVSSIEENTIESEIESVLNELQEDTLEIKEIYIDIEEDDWQAILAAPLEEEYYSASVTIDDDTVDNIGFRTKGNSSLQSVASSESERYGFRVNIDKYEDDQTICGTNEFVLNANFSDPSYMREYITYMAMEELGGIVPDVSYANLYINDEYYGLYLYVGAYDDTFVEGLTDDEDANLYKADGENCTLDSSTGTTGFETKYGDDEEMTNIENLIVAIENADEGSYEELEEILDVDSVLKAMAVNYFCGNYDSYSGDKAHNYYLLYADGEFSYIGWDYNMAFGGYSTDGGASVNVDVDEPIYNTTLEDRPLFKVLLENEEYVAQYEAYLEELAAFLSNWEEIVTTIESQIESYVEIDPTAYYTYEEFKANLVVSGTDLTELQVASNGRTSGDIGELQDEGRMMPAEGDRPEGDLPADMGAMPEEGDLPADMGVMPAEGDQPEGMGRMQGEGERPADMGTITEEGDLPADMGMMPGVEINKSTVSLADYIVTILAQYASSK